MRSLGLLLALTCLGSAGALLGGRHWLQQRAWPDPGTPVTRLERQRRFEPDPERRREAALLLVAADDQAGEPGEAGRTLWLLRNQGWGRDPLAALVLKRSAQAAARQGDTMGSEALWHDLQTRFPNDPASADALYALGRSQPALRRLLLQRFPAHPAALAAAVEAGPQGAVHLARWGARWPNAKAVNLSACSAPPPDQAGAAGQRDALAGALARLGDADAALACLGDGAAELSTQLELAHVLLRQDSDAGGLGDGDRGEAGERRLLELARRHPETEEAAAAVRLLADRESASSLERMAELPETLQNTAPVQARRALLDGHLSSALAVMRRWPKDPASWELQWRLAREHLLQRDWRGAAVLLGTSSMDPASMAAPLDARRRFWLALSRWQLGERPQAKADWADLLARHPSGYYGWRAAARLGRGDLNLDPAAEPDLTAPPWRPLASQRPQLERLWRLGQRLEAWERWRQQRGEVLAESPGNLLLEGRLRRGVGDHWTGLGQLERASLRLPASACAPWRDLNASLAEPAYIKELNAAARQAQVAAPLLAAVARQESRFTSTVRSPVGAVGLLQLMPETAAEVAGKPMDAMALEDPGLNATLGARYLAQLLDRWQGNAFLAVASYNAGPGAAETWISPELATIPELWVEAIPYPETRLYVKKVLGNVWTLQAPREPLCT